MNLDIEYTKGLKMKTEQEFIQREQAIRDRIKKHYGNKLGRSISDEEAKEIADNLLNFAKAVYGA